MKVLATEKIRVERHEAHFDRACDAASRDALFRFGIDDSGNSNKVKGYHRSNCSIQIVFKKYTAYLTMVGPSYVYEFIATVEQVEDDE